MGTENFNPFSSFQFYAFMVVRFYGVLWSAKETTMRKTLIQRQKNLLKLHRVLSDTVWYRVLGIDKLILETQRKYYFSALWKVRIFFKRKKEIIEKMFSRLFYYFSTFLLLDRFAGWNENASRSINFIFIYFYQINHRNQQQQLNLKVANYCARFSSDCSLFASFLCIISPTPQFTVAALIAVVKCWKLQNAYIAFKKRLSTIQSFPSSIYYFHLKTSACKKHYFSN